MMPLQRSCNAHGRCNAPGIAPAVLLDATGRCNAPDLALGAPLDAETAVCGAMGRSCNTLDAATALAPQNAGAERSRALGWIFLKKQ